MKKAFVGGRLRRLREERRLTQQKLASTLGISLSYLNQLENNQRPLTLNVALKLSSVYDFDATLLSDGDEKRLIAELRTALADSVITSPVGDSELRELVGSMPSVGQALIALHQGYQRAVEHAAVLAARLGSNEAGGAVAATPFEEVRDFFHARHNYFDELDRAAEAVAMPPRDAASALSARLSQRHAVTISASANAADGYTARRNYDAATRTLYVSPLLSRSQQAFQMATQLAFLEQGEAIDALVGKASFASDDSRRLARIGLANYFAGALILPYRTFLEAAESSRYDIGILGERFDVSFETVCHRLSTLQRSSARGVPFFFVRVDRAGNISKRQSASDFHFSRVGGACPLWNVYEAFAQPGKILVQVARMPDERAYFWIARSVSHSRGGYRARQQTFSVALGCDIEHSSKLVYSDGVDLLNPRAATPIGPGCRLCDRPACPQRAFPPVGRPLDIDYARSPFAPYATKT